MPKPYAQALCLNPLPKPYAQKGTDLGWGCKDCSDADIECSKRTCTTVCQNGPRVGQSCTVGTAYVCQGGTERDGQFCPDPAAPTECGSMRQGTCDWECPPATVRQERRARGRQASASRSSRTATGWKTSRSVGAGASSSGAGRSCSSSTATASRRPR